MMLRWLLPCLIAVLSGCGTGPGAPLVRSDAADGEGPLLRGCQNLARADTTRDFITEYYLTTWGSASREGAAAGFEAGLATPGGTGMQAMLSGMGYAQLPTSAVYCRRYAMSKRQAYDQAARLLPALGYTLAYADRGAGQLRTAFVDRQRALSEQGPPLHKWRDRYVIEVSDDGSRRSAVRVFREVLISRCNRRDGCSDYIRATSVGHNEAVILNRIEQGSTAGG